MQKLYLECLSGISGDMTVAALLDLGASEEKLLGVLNSIPDNNFGVKISSVKKNGIVCKDFDVVLDEAHDNHDHDMEYLHGHEHHHEQDHEHHHHDHEHEHEHHEHDHEHEHEHHHEHDHEQHHHEHEHHHEHHHEHRALKDVIDILNKTMMTDNARKIALNIFTVLAKAEAKAHGATIDEVHFHEVGAIDSIVDIVSVAVCMDDLNISEVIVPFLAEGEGTIRCAHGILQVPVPAVLNIVSDNNIPLRRNGKRGEFVTPTGAAIVAATKTSTKLPECFTIKATGLGAGKRNYELPSVLRAMIIEESTETKGEIVKLECNIDDSTGEALGFVMEELFKAGARDAFYTPVFMKKNRPGWLLSVICSPDKISELEGIIFMQTTTIGIRRSVMERTVLKRELKSVETSLGLVDVKTVEINGANRSYPEYESVARLCRDKKLSYSETYNTIFSEIN